MPAPISTVAELVDCLRGPLDPVGVERALAGVVALAQTSRATIAAAFDSLVDVVVDPFGEIVRALAPPNIRPRSDAAPEPTDYGFRWETQPAPGRPSGVGHRLVRNGRRSGVDGRGTPPQAMLLGRMREVAEQLASDGLPPSLVATPATVDGHVNPARILLLLVRAERGGWQPGPHDLAQMLLRLPRHVDGSVVGAAARLVSPAGRRFAAWLQAGGLPDPHLKVVSAAGDGARRTVAFAPATPCSTGRRWCTPAAATAGLAVPVGLLEPAPRPATSGAGVQPQVDAGGAPDMGCWPMVLPGHREVIAAHCLPYIAAIAEHGDGGGLGILGGLARAAGPFGPAMALALAHGLTAADDRDRGCAAESVLHLAGTDGIDAELVGRELAVLLTGELAVLPTAEAAVAGRAADSLGLIGRGGAWHVVWAVAHAVIPALLRAETPAPGLTELLTVATEAATATGARGDIPEVNAAAARADGGRLGAEAALLARTLG